ncbi:MAG: hypothetical protein BGP25_12190 [Lysobacterales bacterium 63-13]|nr:MAG: hypothetical protein BGP25_12190 [Xanthomonadales bacterium 63-13]
MPRAGTAAPFWQLDQGNGVIEIYDRAGRYIQRIDADDPSRNLMISYFGGQIDIDASYSANGPHQQEDFWRINRVTDGNGRYASFQYSNDNYLWLTRIVADDGLTVLAEFHYDSDHRMERLTYADLSERTYLYNEPSNIFVGGAIPTGLRGYWLTGILDEDNRRFGTFRYDDWGRVVDNWHGTDSEKVHIDYLSDSASKVTFPSGVETTFNYAANEPYRHPGASSNTAGTRQYEYYPSNHRLKKVTDANNNVSEQEYDLLGIHLTAKVEAKNTPEQRRTEFDWDAPTNRIYEKRIYKQPNNGTSVLTHRVVYGYNTGGALLSSTETDVLSGATRTNTFDYCPNTSSLSGCVLGRLRSIDGPRTDVADVTTLRYYTTADLSGCATVNGGECHQLGDLKSITNAVGQVVTYAKYDRAGRVIRVRDANNVLTDFSYSVRGWLTDRISRANANGSSSPQDAKTHFTYDGSGNVKRVTFPDLAFPAYSLEYSYDSAHRLTGVIDSHGNSASYTLDPSGNRTGESYLNDQGVLKRSLGRIYDELGRLERVLNSQGIPVLTSALPPDSPPAGITYTGGYDGNGNSVYSYDGLGRDTFRQYDALNRLTTIMQDHSGQSSATQDATTEMQYDERDNLVSVTDPDDLTTGYVHDGLNNLRSITSPDTGTTFYTPDNAGNRTAQTDARGVTGTYAFDALNRLTSITFASSPSENVSYAYDLADRTTGCSGAASNGHLSRMMDESGMTTYCYDRRGNVVRKAQDGVIQRVVEYSYDRADRLLSMTYPSGAVVTYVRDAIGRIIAVTRKADAAAPAVSIISSATYLPFGPLNQLTYGNGRTLTKSYDGDYAIDSVVSSDPNGLLIDFTTNVMGNIIDASDSLGANPKTRTYQYDPLYRLTDVLDGTSASVEHYTYSATGDRTSRQLGNQAPQVHAYAAGSHRIESIDGVYRGYDANGNTEIRGSGPQFSYGERNRLSTVTLPSGQSLFGRGGGANQIFYRYNGRGERVVQRQSLMLQETNYLYDEAGHQVGKYVGMDAMSLGEEIIYLDDLPVAITFNGVLSYLETDHLGTPRVAANPSTNAQQWKWDFFGDAFGDNAATIAPSGGVDVRLRYPGQYFDAESGLHYNYFRDYEPGTGRYVESDPIGLGGGNSTYAYTRSAPLGRTDHLGLWGSQKTRYIHQWSWQRVAPQGMTTADQWAVEYALGYADREEYQDAAHAYMHAMNGDKAMSTDKACAKSNDFIKSQYEEAWELDSQGKHREALFQFGIALHTIQDSMSPAHSGFQLWTGEETKREIFDHLTRELSDPGSGSELDTATRNAWEWYSSRQFPTNGAVKCDCP